MSLDDRLRTGLDSAASQFRPDAGRALVSVLDRRRRYRYVRGAQGLAAAAAVIAAILVGPQLFEETKRPGDVAQQRPAALPASGPLTPGTYSTGDLRPALNIQVPSGWSVVERSSDHLSLQRADGTRFTLVRLEGVFPPGRPSTRSELTGAPDDLMVWLESHPDLEVLGTASATIDVEGQEGRYVDVRVTQNPATTSRSCAGPCVAVTAAVTAFPITVPGGHNARFVDFEIDGTRMLSVASSPADQFQDFAPEADAILRSIRSQD